MKRFSTLSFICLVFTLFCFSCSKTSSSRHSLSHTVLVSIAPYKFFIEKIAQDTVKIIQMTPTGASPHSYEPTSHAILKGGQADIWFRIGEPFEKRALPAIQSYNPHIRDIDLREGTHLIADTHEKHSSCHHEDCRDPHLWLSPKEVAKQITLITKVLSETYPEYREKYQQELEKVKKELQNLHQELKTLLHPIKSQTILVAHNAYAYLARDYGFSVLPIEFEGRDPSPQQLTDTIDKARKLHIKKLFIQPQHLSKGSRLIARELNAEVVELDPYAEAYFDNLRMIAKQFATQ